MVWYDNDRVKYDLWYCVVWCLCGVVWSLFLACSNVM